ncbi:hypothetical protein AVEN_94058-1 [Araneus ventricosus]|uniref:Uncharacterized protein n=1 Tax=Araneus ventricosus TaxID=182803 RepID=A0A4Y2S7N2_ARAVE|nr:hypothetical protein AVEN_94058-1 [Araneus ventricosus]
MFYRVSDLLAWTARSPDLLHTDVWDIIERQLQRPSTTSINSSLIYRSICNRHGTLSHKLHPHLYDTIHARLHAYIQNSDAYGNVPAFHTFEMTLLAYINV